jgi:DNA invertase Pin-like site-specific DNA recombinase
MSTKKIPAVAYVRASDDDQDGSCGQQRGLIGRYAAAHGYDILRWYEDDGISGLTAEDRPRFRAMTADLALGDFEAVLVRSQDRFSRAEPRYFFADANVFADQEVQRRADQEVQRSGYGLRGR